MLDHRAAPAASGTLKLKMLPRGEWFEAEIDPPWASTMERQIDKPMPMPPALVLKKASKIRSM
jgi:hypothetical protein